MTDEKITIRLFPGSQAEYERFRGYGVEVIDLKGIDFGVFARRINDEVFDFYYNGSRVGSDLAERGVEALVNVTRVLSGKHSLDEGNNNYYGLPVRKMAKRSENPV